MFFIVNGMYSDGNNLTRCDPTRHCFGIHVILKLKVGNDLEKLHWNLLTSHVSL